MPRPAGAQIVRLVPQLPAVLRRLVAPGLSLVGTQAAARQPEFAIGAIGEDGEVYLSPSDVLEIEPSYIQQEREFQLREIARRQQLFRAVRPQASITGRSVILTDDGIATGATMIAALHAVEGRAPYELIVAVPVASPDRLKLVRPLCDRLICLLAPEQFYAVGQFYLSFDPVEDDEVVRILQEFAPQSQPVT